MRKKLRAGFERGEVNVVNLFGEVPTHILAIQGNQKRSK